MSSQEADNSVTRWTGKGSDHSSSSISEHQASECSCLPSFRSLFSRHQSVDTSEEDGSAEALRHNSFTTDLVQQAFASQKKRSDPVKGCEMVEIEVETYPGGGGARKKKQSKKLRMLRTADFEQVIRPMLVPDSVLQVVYDTQDSMIRVIQRDEYSSSVHT